MGMGHNDKLKVLFILNMNIVSNIDHRLHWLLYAGSERSGEDGLPRGELQQHHHGPRQVRHQGHGLDPAQGQGGLGDQLQVTQKALVHKCSSPTEDGLDGALFRILESTFFSVLCKFYKQIPFSANLNQQFIKY